MCGLVGMVGNIEANHKKLFNDLLALDSIRGFHSTGVLTVDRFGGHASQVVKIVGDGFDMLGYKPYDAMMTYSKCLMMGHNRYATKGKINKVNAHPFEQGKIIGAHNGTLRKQDLLDDHKYFDVDSENIFYHMNKNGVADTIKKLDGAFALTWWDKQDLTMNFVRNRERPLHLCYTKDRKTIIWASEPWMIEVAATRQKIEITDIVSIEEGRHYCVKVPGLGTTHAIGNMPTFTIEDLTVREVEMYKLPFTTTSTKSGGKSSSTSTTFPSNTGKYTGLGTSGKKAGADFSAYSDYIGETIEFTIDGTELDENNTMFISGSCVDDEDVRVRAYVEYKSELWDELVNSMEAWQGLTKRFTAAEGGYLLIDLRTLVELPGLLDELNEEALRNPKYKVWGGRLVDITEYNHLTRNGCCWCGDFVGPGDSDEIVWVDSGDFICSSCKHDPTVTYYYRYTE